MTKERIIYCRNEDGTINTKCPHEKTLFFNDWVRSNLPDSNTGYYVTDIDFVFVNSKTGKIMLIEVKTHSKVVSVWQKNIFKIISNAVKLCVPKRWRYLEYNLIQFENSNFTDGKVYLNHKEITETQLKDFLSMNN